MLKTKIIFSRYKIFKPNALFCKQNEPNSQNCIKIPFPQSVPGVVESLKVITREKSHRIAKYAFDYAMRHDRKRVTAIHKANIMWVGHTHYHTLY